MLPPPIAAPCRAHDIRMTLNGVCGQSLAGPPRGDAVTCEGSVSPIKRVLPMRAGPRRRQGRSHRRNPHGHAIAGRGRDRTGAQEDATWIEPDVHRALNDTCVHNHDTCMHNVEPTTQPVIIRLRRNGTSLAHGLDCLSWSAFNRGTRAGEGTSRGQICSDKARTCHLSRSPHVLSPPLSRPLMLSHAELSLYKH